MTFVIDDLPFLIIILNDVQVRIFLDALDDLQRPLVLYVLERLAQTELDHHVGRRWCRLGHVLRRGIDSECDG